MRADVEQRAPEEACGLIAGKGNQALEVIAVPNLLHSSVRFRMDPPDQWAAFKRMEEQGQELIGIYHSHPAGPDGPSQTDIQEAFYPEAASLIWSPVQGSWRCRAYRIVSGAVQEIPVAIDLQE